MDVFTEAVSDYNDLSFLDFPKYCSLINKLNKHKRICESKTKKVMNNN